MNFEYRNEDRSGDAQRVVETIENFLASGDEDLRIRAQSLIDRMREQSAGPYVLGGLEVANSSGTSAMVLTRLLADGVIKSLYE